MNRNNLKASKKLIRCPSKLEQSRILFVSLALKMFAYFIFIDVTSSETNFGFEIQVFHRPRGYSSFTINFQSRFSLLTY